MFIVKINNEDINKLLDDVSSRIFYKLFDLKSKKIDFLIYDNEKNNNQELEEKIKNLNEIVDEKELLIFFLKENHIIDIKENSLTISLGDYDNFVDSIPFYIIELIFCAIRNKMNIISME